MRKGGQMREEAEQSDRRRNPATEEQRGEDHDEESARNLEGKVSEEFEGPVKAAEKGEEGCPSQGDHRKPKQGAGEEVLGIARHQLLSVRWGPIVHFDSEIGGHDLARRRWCGASQPCS